MTLERIRALAGDMGSQILARTPLNSNSVFGLSLGGAYHSLMIYIDRTGEHTKLHIVDQFTFDTYLNVSDFNNAIENHFHSSKWNLHKTSFTQYFR